MNYCMIVNPASGSNKGVRIMQYAVDKFRQNNIKIEVLVSEYKGHPYSLAKDIDLHVYDALLAIGGDGTIHEVINGIMDRKDRKKIPIGIIPGGTGNSLAHDLGVLDPETAIQHIINREIKKIDLVQLRTPSGILYSFNIVGWGMPEQINTLAERWRRVGSRRYDLASLYEIIFNPRWKVLIRLDEVDLEGEYSFFLACNTVYSGNGMKVAPKAVMNDGKIDVLVVKTAPRWKLIRLFARIFSGNHVKDPVISYYQVSSFEIIPEEKGSLNVDGQITGTTPVSGEVLPGVMELLI